MPSRKKAKGQARKAAKVKNEAAEKARKEGEVFRLLEQYQIQRLQINNQSSVLPICIHGFDPFPNDHICIKFIRAFVHQFYKWFRKIYKARKQDERAVIEILLHARESTQVEYSDVWNSADKMKQVISYFLYNGTVLVLDRDEDNSLHSALFARFFEEWLKVKVHQSQACINWLKLNESVGWCDKHSRVKYFWRRIRCSCLDNAYEEVKSIPKEGICFNHDCAAHPGRSVERSKLRCCSRCRSVTYCSRECQAADWPVHKEFCDEVAATRAEFDARQQQQS